MKNALGFPLINPAIFGHHDLETNADIEQVLRDYERFGVATDCNPPGPTYDIQPINPPNQTLSEWTNGLARDMVPHVDELEEFAAWCYDVEIEPIVPLYQAGWTRYSLLTGKTKQVPHPTESVFVFDCETFVKGSDYGHAIIATAVSSKALYVWLHPSFVDSSTPYQPTYVPVGTNKLIIGHNVTGFDRGRCEGSAVFGQPTNYWLDTMSMHMVTSGLTSAQRFWFMEKNPRYVPQWSNFGSMANLMDCYKFYCFKDDSEISLEQWEYIETDDTDQIKALLMQGWEIDNDVDF